MALYLVQCFPESYETMQTLIILLIFNRKNIYFRFYFIDYVLLYTFNSMSRMLLYSS